MSLRDLPGVDEVAARLGRAADAPRALLISEIRRALEQARDEIRRGAEGQPDIDTRVLESLVQLRSPSLRRVINATGVVLHTNLGRAPLAPFTPVEGYSNLEYDLGSGRRGKRDVHISGLLERLTGKPGIAVNNNAAAVWLVLHELAAGAEVIVSRGQLIEIGDGFRIPDIMQRAGVTLREVGTTNRTRIEDYAGAISDRTRLLLLVHPSNFRIQGFTAQPSRKEVVALGREHSIPVYQDLGSGALLDLSPYGIEEPLVKDCLGDGVNVVSFSGDKLMGGPQAGVIAGDANLVARLRRNPMFRAFRLDKLILRSLETTLRSLLFEEYDCLPALRMIRASAEEIRRRAEAMAGRIGAAVVPGESVIGGGSTPEQTLPTFRIALRMPDVVASERRLRAADPPVIALIDGDQLLVDLRTVLPEEESLLENLLRITISSTTSATAASPRS